MREQSIGVDAKFLMCNLCGRQFGHASLPIHQKQCAEKQAIQVAQHKQMMKNMKEPVAISGMWNQPGFSGVMGVRIGRTGTPPTETPIKVDERPSSPSNIEAHKKYQRLSLDHGAKFECEFCTRSFARPDSMMKHRKLCEKESQRGSKLYQRHGINSADIIQRTVVVSPKPKPQSPSKIEKTGIGIVDPSFVSRPSTPAPDVINLASTCSGCSMKFDAEVTTKWKFCPSCGAQRERV